MLQYDEQSEMSHDEYIKLARNEGVAELNEDLFWESLSKQIKMKKFPIYSIDNGMSRYRADWKFFNISTMTVIDSILQVATIPGNVQTFTYFKTLIEKN